MANNTVINAGSGGDTIATVDLSAFTAYPATGKLPTSVLYLSVNGTTAPTPVSTANPLPVSQQGAVNAAQSGSWTVSVSGTTAVSGTVTANQGGSNWSVNAAQVAGTATDVNTGNASAGTQRVVLASNQPAVPVTQSGSWTVTTSGTTTVGGTVTANQGGAPWSQNVTQWNGTTVDTNSGLKSAGTVRVVIATDQPSLTNAQPVSQSGSWAVSVSGTATVSGTVTANAGTGTFTVGGPAASGTAAGGNPVMAGGVFNTTQPTVTTGQVVDLQATARGGLIVATGADTFAVTATQSGTWNVAVNAALPAGSNTVGAVTQASGPWTVNVTQVGGASVTLGSKTSANSFPVVIASDQGAVPASQSGTWTVQQGGAPWSVSQSGTWNVTVNTALPAGTAQIGHVVLDAASASGGTTPDYTHALSTTVRAVKASAGRLYSVQVQNPNGTDCWVQFFDLAAGSVTLGTTTPKKAVFVPALGATALDFVNGWSFATAVSVAATTTDNGNTAPAAGLVWNADYA